MRTFTLFLETLQKVDIQAESIEQAKELLERKIKSNPKSTLGFWEILIPQEAEVR